MSGPDILARFEGMEIDPTPYPLVYIAGVPGKPRHPVKIGKSNSNGIHNRLRALQTGCPYRLEYIFVSEAGSDMEARIHAAFSQARLEGEWFARTRAVNAFIRHLLELEPDWQKHLKIRLRRKDPPHDPS